jgi:cytochrome c oxidase subunit 3
MTLDSRLLTQSERQMLEHTVLVRHRLEEHYEDLEQQSETAVLGMWLFLATEIMFFGTLFTVLGVYRYLYPEAFEAASRRLNWQVGGLNTFVLLISSLTMALAVYYARLGRTRSLVPLLLVTAILGSAFLGLKGYEYYQDIQEGLVLGSRFDASAWIGKDALSADQIPPVKLFLLLYWIMTGAHAVHMIIGIVAVLTMAALAKNNRFDAAYYAPIDVTGLYWHFVDIVWIFLFPMLYLLGTHR